MAPVTAELTVESTDRLTTVDITDDVRETIPASMDAGLCSVYVQHTTAALIVNENEPRLRTDTETFLQELVPETGHEHDTIDNNADSHLRATLLGPDVTVPVRDGDLALGTWGSMLLIECDGPRTRTVSVTITGE